MSSDENVVGGLAGRYAVALFELAQDLPQEEAASIAETLAGLKALISDSADLQKLIRSPVISAAEQNDAMAAILTRVGAHRLVMNFVALVIEKRRAFALPEMAGQYAALVARNRDELIARITAARALNDGQIDALKDQLQNALGKSVIVEVETDASLLGGMIVKLGSRMIDGSLRTKLNSLKTAMNEAS
ncbi:MAG: F0F1 ATP synthase subunit delta [Parvibaculales bacterium]